MLSRPPQLIVATASLLLLTWLGFSINSAPDLQTPIDVVPSAPAEQTDEPLFYQLPAGGHLLGHGGIQNLTSNRIEIAKIEITALQKDGYSPPLMQPLDVRLPSFIDFTPNEHSEKPPQTLQTSRVSVKIPRVSANRTDASAFIFGVATTYERLEESLDQFSYWSVDSGTKIIALTEPSLDGKAAKRVLAKARKLNIPIRIVESGMSFLDRYFSLLKVMYENKQATTRWFSFIDDDTFFPSLSNIVSTLSKYDPVKPYYVGALTEDFVQMAQWGFMGYGGAGVFVSQGLITELLPHFQDCLATRSTGDRMLAHCIYRHTSTKLTWEHGLHQMDIHGSHAGFYEALRPQPLSLHHWKSDEFQSFVDMFNMSKVAKVCGEKCLLQKYRLKDDWILTNGFSLVKYSEGDLRNRDLNTDISMERTWFYYGGTNEAHFQHSLAPLRSADPGKITYKMESAVVDADGSVRQLYIRRDSNFDVQGVVEIAWRR